MRILCISLRLKPEAVLGSAQLLFYGVYPKLPVHWASAAHSGSVLSPVETFELSELGEGRAILQNSSSPAQSVSSVEDGKPFPDALLTVGWQTGPGSNAACGLLWMAQSLAVVSVFSSH